MSWSIEEERPNRFWPNYRVKYEQPSIVWVASTQRIANSDRSPFDTRPGSWQAEPGGKRSDARCDQRIFIGPDPPDDIIVLPISVHVLERDLRLPHPTHSVKNK